MRISVKTLASVAAVLAVVSIAGTSPAFALSATSRIPLSLNSLSTPVTGTDDPIRTSSNGGEEDPCSPPPCEPPPCYHRL